MITIEEDFFKELVNPVLFADKMGRILIMNDPAAFMLRSASLQSIRSIAEIDPQFGKQESAKFLKVPRDIQVGKVSRRIRVFSGRFTANERFYLYLFSTADVMKLMDFDHFLDCMDVAVAISDQDGVLEHLNDTFSKYIGVDAREWVGRNLHHLIEERTLSNSASLNALKAKKPMSTNVTYATGITLQWQSIPFFDNRGRIKKVVSTGRDVTRLIQLESDLSSS